MYTIGKVSEMFGLPVSTLRYYDKQGLFPQMRRSSGIRQFGDKEIAILRIVECLKKSGLELHAIKQYVQWMEQGDETISKRRDLFERQRQMVMAEMQALEDTLAILNYKAWYYETAQQAGTCEIHKSLTEADIPEEHRRASRMVKGTLET